MVLATRWHSPSLSLYATRGRSSGPSHHRRLCCPSGSIGTMTASDALPATPPFPGSSPVIGTVLSADSQPLRPGRASPVPAVTFRTFRAHYAGEFLVAAIQALHHFHGLRPERAGSALPLPRANAGTLTTPQASLDAADRSVASPMGLLTLGFDPDRFQSEPPACYRASWQLPGPDLHRLATTSFRSGQLLDKHLLTTGRTLIPGVNEPRA